MALPSSGAITLSDVNSNIGASSTAAITMNDTAVHWLANGDATTNPVSMNSLYGKSWVWTSNISQAGFSGFNPQATAVDSNGYIYTTAFINTNGLFVIKTNPIGVVQWVTKLSPVSGYAELSPSTYRGGIAVSSSGNVYVSLGHRNTTAPIYYRYGVAKLNSSGTLQWSSYLIAPASHVVNGSLSVDNSDNVYLLAFNDQTNPPSGSIVAKFDTSGSLSWQKKVETLFGVTGSGAVNVDATNGYVYVTGYTTAPGGFLGKFDTNLSLQWGANLYTAAGCNFAAAAINTSNQNVYVAVSSPVAGIAKYNSSGSLQWQKSFSGGASYLGVAVDSSDNAYVQLGDFTTGNPYIVKVSTSGSVSSQLQFAPVGMSYATAYNMGGVVTTGNTVATMLNTTTSTAPVNGGSIIKLTNGLTTTGTYGRVSLSSSALSVSDTAYTASSVSPTVATSAFSTSTSLVSGSDVTSSFTKTVSLI